MPEWLLKVKDFPGETFSRIWKSGTDFFSWSYLKIWVHSVILQGKRVHFLIREKEIACGAKIPDMHLLYFPDIVRSGMAVGENQIGPAAVAEVHQVVGRIIFLELFILFLIVFSRVQ